MQSLDSVNESFYISYLK